MADTQQQTAIYYLSNSCDQDEDNYESLPIDGEEIVFSTFMHVFPTCSENSAVVKPVHVVGAASIKFYKCNCFTPCIQFKPDLWRKKS